MKLTVYRSNHDGDWYVRTVADNGEILSTTEGHRRRIDAVDIARKLAPEGAEVEVLDD
jgi:uncharacterized protein YegP (UPF0339 family)